MPIRRLPRRLLLTVAALVAAFAVAPAASAAALSTVVDVGTSVGSITPATVTGSPGDTFQIQNSGTDPNDPFYSITVQPGTGSVSIDGVVCDSGSCQIRDGVTKTATIITPGTLTIERWMGMMNSVVIGTVTIAAPAAPAAAPAASLTCASSNWNFGVVDYSQTGYGDQILVTWGLPKVCSGTVASFALRQTTPDGTSTNVPAAACSPDLVVKAGSSDALWSCALKVAAVPANTLEFQVVATTTGGQQATSRSVKWVRGAAPNADVALPGTAVCGGASTPLCPDGVPNKSLIYFIVSLVIQTEFASNGNQALTDKQARELLNIGVFFSDEQSARAGRAAKWVSIGKKTIKIKKAGKLRVALPLSKKGTALLRKGPLKVRVTYTLTRGTAKRTIVQFATLPRIAS